MNQLEMFDGGEVETRGTRYVLCKDRNGVKFAVVKNEHYLTKLATLLDFSERCFTLKECTVISPDTLLRQGYIVLVPTLESKPDLNAINKLAPKNPKQFMNYKIHIF